MTFFKKNFPILAAVLFVAGCSAEKEVISGKIFVRPIDVINAVNVSSASVKTFSADGSISVASPRITQSAGFELEVKRPDSVKLTIEGPFGITVARALLTKERFIAYSAFQNSLYEGRTDTKAGFMKMIDIPPSMIMDALAGIRRFDDGESEPDSFFVTGNSYMIQFHSDKNIKKYSVDILSGRIVGVETLKREDGALLWRETYEYEYSDSAWNPVSVTITVPERQTTVEIVYNDIRINPVLQSLSIAYPSDAERIIIE